MSHVPPPPPPRPDEHLIGEIEKPRPKVASLAVYEIRLSAIVDMSYADSEGRSNDEAFGFVQVRVQVDDQDFRGPSIPIMRPDVPPEKEPETVARLVAQWLLDRSEKGHGHHVR